MNIRRKGASLPFVIIIFVIATIIAGIVFTIFSTNLKQTLHQENSIKAYYCTLMGLEIATGALLMDSPYIGPGEPKTMLEAFASNPSKVLKDSIPIPDGRSKVDVTISSPEKPGDTDGNQWVRIYAVGTYKDAGGKTYTNSGSIWYRVDNPAIYEQELNI